MSDKKTIPDKKAKYIQKLEKDLAIITKKYNKLQNSNKKLQKKYTALQSNYMTSLNSISEKDKLLGKHNDTIYKSQPSTVIKTSYGSVASYQEDTDTVIRALKKHGEYQTHVVDLFKKYVRPDSIIVDVGANVGFFTLVYSKLMPSCHIHSFEIMPKTYNALKNTVKLNNLKNVTCHNIGLFNEETDVNVSFKPYMLGHTFIHEIPNKIGTEATCTTLDKYGLKNVSFIKLDIQGAEYEALLGAKQTLIDNDCTVLAEFTRTITPFQNNKSKYKATVAFMKSVGYKIVEKIRKEYVFQKVKESDTLLEMDDNNELENSELKID